MYLLCTRNGKNMITRINKKLAQQIVETVKDVCGQDINFIDEQGMIFASTDETRIGDYHEAGKKVMNTGETIEVEETDKFSGSRQGVNMPIYHNGIIIAVIGISGNPHEVRKYAYLADKITQLLIREQELNNYNRAASERKTYILDALINRKKLDHDYLMDALKDFHIDEQDSLRIVIIRMNSRYHPSNISMIQQQILSLFSRTGITLYYYHYPNEYVGVISKDTFDKNHMIYQDFAEKNAEILNIGVGIKSTIYHLDHSYETGVIAIKSIQSSYTHLTLYDDLTLEIITGTLDQRIKTEYMNKTIATLSDNDLMILNRYYENNMSLTETAHSLYLHKNTLQYRLNHVATVTGFNPRVFQDAVVLYLALTLRN